MADQTRIDQIIDKHPLNGRYGFTREDVIHQLRTQCDLAGAEAIGSQRRGASKMMVKQETVMYLAMLALAALSDDPADEYVECQSTMHTWTYGFSPNAVDSYDMTCDLTYPHDEHENSHTGAKWRDNGEPTGEPRL